MIFCEFGPCFRNQNHCLSSLKVQPGAKLLSPHHPLFLSFQIFKNCRKRFL
ncbi:hypothetical protein Fmac_024536 [Flemingia macrophylla]|uniref:Uncharacterized protein n=1 Tax=Flemingia macrophylla TaxID=520843 RepID=A0ABD1LPR3_9FABA